VPFLGIVAVVSLNAQDVVKSLFTAASHDSLETLLVPFDFELGSNRNLVTHANADPAVGFVLNHGRNMTRMTYRFFPQDFRASYEDFPWLFSFFGHAPSNE
jgi:hypothetical protein